MKEKDIYHFIRKRIRAIRRRKNLTAKQVAERAGIPVSSYASIETGVRSLNIHRLCILSALNVDILEVWPPAWHCPTENPLAVTLPDVDKVNWFRFREIFVQSGASSACLISKAINHVDVIYSINTTEDEQKHLVSDVKHQARRISDWEILSKEKRGFSLHLLLKDARLSDCERRLANLYLSMWIAAREL